MHASYVLPRKYYKLIDTVYTFSTQFLPVPLRYISSMQAPICNGVELLDTVFRFQFILAISMVFLQLLIENVLENLQLCNATIQ